MKNAYTAIAHLSPCIEAAEWLANPCEETRSAAAAADADEAAYAAAFRHLLGLTQKILRK